jgi:hypothetical protein
MRTLVLSLLFAASVGFIAGCSDSGSDSDTTTDGSDTSDVEDLAEDLVDLDDGDVEPDGDIGEDLADLDTSETDTVTDLPFGEACITSLQCNSNLCVTFASGIEGFCSRICEQNSDCEQEGPQYECLSLPQSSSDEVRGCIDTGFCYDPDNDGYGDGPGCENVGFDCDQTDPLINPGAFERCDAVDHNCNGLLIDSVVFEEPDCDVGDPSVQGVCATGERRCEPVTNDDDEVIDGTEVCEQIVFAGELDEVCNGRDDDCDGVRDDFVDDNGTPDDPSDDEYEVPGLGISCSTEVDSCPNGITTCDQSSGEVVCVATGDNPTGGDESLVCDGIDNNCNGETDEPFKNEDGIYFMTESCGSCDVDCNNFFEGRPEDFNVVPFCDVQENFAVCDFDCAEGFVDADGLEDNGCELNPDEEAVYVTRSARGGEDNEACGSYESPCATINFAINKASGDGSKARVRVAEGSYGEAVTLVDGVSVLGGHNATNWTRNVDANVTTITGGQSDGTQTVSVTADGISSDTEFSGFTVRAPATRNGENSVGILLTDSTDALAVTNNRVFAGAAGNGENGSRGSNGTPGVNGGDGVGSRNNRDNCGDPRPGGAGGDRSCPNLRGSGTIDVSGGDGADGDGCPEYGTGQAPGQAGSGPGSPGEAGLSQHHLRGFTIPGFLSCRLPEEGDITDGTELVRFATVGGRGTIGDDGDAGSGAASAEGTFAGSAWRGVSGSSGQPGLPGDGGGGGGAPSGVEDIRDSDSEFYYPPSGGGGGSGGCAGDAGGGGTAGGGSFAIVIVQTSTSSVPDISGNSFSRGIGGQGGSGGIAGSGGDGGTAGSPGIGDNQSGSYGFCMANGKAGGAGGRGGHGGGGGGGAGGASFDVLVFSSDPDSAISASGVIDDNQFPTDAGTDTGGDGGAGGSSQTNVGESGADGAFGRVLKLQP